MLGDSTALPGRRCLLEECVAFENEIRDIVQLLGVKLPNPLKHGAVDAAVRQAIELQASVYKGQMDVYSQ